MKETYFSPVKMFRSDFYRDLFSRHKRATRSFGKLLLFDL